MGLGSALVNNSAVKVGMVGGSAIGGIAGMAGGAFIGSTMPGASAGTGALAGGAIGLAAAPMFGLAAAGAIKGGASVLKHSDKIAAGAYGVGSAAVKGAAKLGVGTAALGIKPSGLTGNFMMGTPVTRHARAGLKTMEFLGGAVKYQPESYKTNGKGELVRKAGKMKLTGRAYGLAAAGALIMGGKKAHDDYYQSKAGTPMGTQRATPSYLNNGGANGDLVFALNANRRG